MRELRADPDVALQVIATGMHLSPRFGDGRAMIEADGFAVDAAVDVLLGGDDPVAVARSIGHGTIGCAEALARLRPDIVVVLGDRFEILAAAQAAYVARIPIAHIHGGEATFGVLDEAFRHAITKMAHLHCTAAPAFRHRVIQLGEDPARVFVVGALGYDAVANLVLLDQAALEQSLDFALGPQAIAVTFHPETLSGRDAASDIGELLAALDGFADARVVFTMPNADPGGQAIAAAIERWVAARPDRAKAFVDLGQRRYLSLLRHAAAVVGNSSSGIIEAPFLGVPTVNIGDRQQGRPRADSVLDCACTREDIAAAVATALSPAFRELAKDTRSPYGEAGAAQRIAELLKTTPLDGIPVKAFHDVEFAA
jgi:UDP-hydrolysing UDP-N-acetyl-D-glucosamine 2-epimerase